MCARRGLQKGARAFRSSFFRSCAQVAWRERGAVTILWTDVTLKMSRAAKPPANSSKWLRRRPHQTGRGCRWYAQSLFSLLAVFLSLLSSLCCPLFSVPCSFVPCLPLTSPLSSANGRIGPKGYTTTFKEQKGHNSCSSRKKTCRRRRGFPKEKISKKVRRLSFRRHKSCLAPPSAISQHQTDLSTPFSTTLPSAVTPHKPAPLWFDDDVNDEDLARAYGTLGVSNALLLKSMDLSGGSKAK